MAKLDEVLYNLVEPIVDDKENLSVTVEDQDNERECVLLVRASSGDVARLIGRKGAMASALRQVMNIAMHSERKRIIIKFEDVA